MLKIYAMGLSLVLAIATARADAIGQYIADQVQTASYQAIHQTLYVEAGDNKGPNGAEHDLCRDVIFDTFDAYGLQVEFDPFVFNGQTYENVVATQLGVVDPNVIYILGAHYDSVNNAGADDDATGVAGILEIARVLSQYPTAYTIRYIAWDMEEQGLRGSNHYVADTGVAGVQAMIQLDMIGRDAGENRQDIFGNSTFSAPLKQAVAAAVAEYGQGLQVSVNGALNVSDHVPFQSAGIPALFMVEHDYPTNNCYHQACDNITVNPNYLNYVFAANAVRSIAGLIAQPNFAQVIIDCPGDLDGDLDVDLSDLGLLLSAYSASDGGDTDGDGDTDLSDLGVVLANYGVNCTR